MNKQILGIDCGVKNLAYCLYNTETKNIQRWDVIDVSENASIPYIPDMSINYLDKHTYLLECDKVLIEKQPPRNGKMRVMEASLYCYFTLRGKLDENKQISCVETYSAKHKLGGMVGLSGKKSYGARKKAAINKVKEILGKETSDVWLRYFCEHKKRDDLADAYLMVLAYIEQQKTIHEAPEKRILARKPKQDTKITDYTAGNIKYTLRKYQQTYKDIQELFDYLNESHQDLLKHILEKYTTVENSLNKLKL